MKHDFFFYFNESSFYQMMDWLYNSLLHSLDFFAGYEIGCLLKKSPLFQLEIAYLSDTKGVGETCVLCRTKMMFMKHYAPYPLLAKKGL